MRDREPFQPGDLRELGDLLDRADKVVAMEDIHDGETGPGVIGLRHDVDNVIAPAVAMAEWEAERGYRSTYFVLHTAPYWSDKDTLRASLETIAECGHEIGFHVNAITEAIRTGRDPLDIIDEAVTELRGYGHRVRGVVAHGDSACYRFNYVNDEVFTESARPDYGAPDRHLVGNLHLQPVSRKWFGFDYDPNWLPRDQYLSDSGGQWSQPFENADPTRRLHMLVHPDWWAQAFHTLEVAA